MPHQLRATPHLHSVETRCDKRIGFVIGHVFGNHQHPHVPGNHPAIWKVTEFACCTPHKIFLINDENITIKKYSSFCLSLSLFFLSRAEFSGVLSISVSSFFLTNMLRLHSESISLEHYETDKNCFFCKRRREETTKPRHHQNQHLRAEKSLKKNSKLFVSVCAVLSQKPATASGIEYMIHLGSTINGLQSSHHCRESLCWTL